MKRILLVVSLSLLVAGMAFAQAPRFMMRGPVQPDTITIAVGVHTIRALHQELVTALGITPAELRLFAVEGKTLGDIAGELGIDLAALTVRLVEARNAAIDTAVANGQLTEEAAVALKAQSEAVAQAFLQQEPGAIGHQRLHHRLARDR